MAKPAAPPMDPDVRKALIGVFFLVSVMLLQRLNIHETLPGRVHMFTDSIKSSSSSLFSASSYPQQHQYQQQQNSDRLTIELAQRRERLNALRAQNDALRGQQATILATVGRRDANGALIGEGMKVGVAAGTAGFVTSDSSSSSSSHYNDFAAGMVRGGEEQATAALLRSGGSGGVRGKRWAARQAQTPGGMRPPPRERPTPPSSLFAASPPASSSLSSAKLSGQVVVFQHKRSGVYLQLDEKDWLTGDVDAALPLARRAFTVVDAGGGGWVALKSVSSGLFLEMVPPTQPLAWVVRLGKLMASSSSSSSLSVSHGMGFAPRQKWKVDGGRMLNFDSGGFINLITPLGAPHSAKRWAVRGHGNAPNKNSAAGLEPTTLFQVIPVATPALANDRLRVAKAAAAEKDSDAEQRRRILELPASREKRVVSYGLYGSNPKYTTGAIRNSELVKVYFPGWVARFYCDSSVPKAVLQQLEANGAEIAYPENIKGAIAGMFWRFLVADDPAVDRFIVRDTDSRLNARERFAVEEWVASGKGVHSIRDHPNHERPLNGGLWGGRKGAVPGMTKLVKGFSNKGKYGLDLTFLNEKVWPAVKHDQMSHDAYSCGKFPNAHPFPTQRPANYQHVGQVFTPDGPGGADQPRMGDINGFMRNRATPLACRKQHSWKFG